MKSNYKINPMESNNQIEPNDPIYKIYLIE